MIMYSLSPTYLLVPVIQSMAGYPFFGAGVGFLALILELRTTSLPAHFRPRLNPVINATMLTPMGLSTPGFANLLFLVSPCYS